MPYVRTPCPNFGHLLVTLKYYFLQDETNLQRNCEWTLSLKIVLAFELYGKIFFVCMYKQCSMPITASKLCF